MQLDIFPDMQIIEFKIYKEIFPDNFAKFAKGQPNQPMDYQHYLDILMLNWEQEHSGYALRFALFETRTAFSESYIIKFKIYKDSILFAKGEICFTSYPKLWEGYGTEKIISDLMDQVERSWKAALPIENGPASIALSKKYTKHFLVKTI